MGPRTSSKSLFRLPDTFGKILSLVTHYLAIFDALAERGVWVAPISDLYKPFHDHDVTIILFSTFSLNLKVLNKKKKNYKNLNI